MTTSIVLATMGLIVICLVVLLWKMFSSYQESTQKLMESQQTASSADRQAILQVAQSALSATTGATTKWSDDQRRLMETISTGMREGHEATGNLPTDEQTDREPEPGIETLDGLPDNIRQTLEREREEGQRLQRVSQMPPVDLDRQWQPMNGQGRTIPSAWIQE